MVSKNYKTWKTTKDLKTCFECKKLGGKIYAIYEQVRPEPPLHPNCRCKIIALQALVAGTATKKGQDGADWWLKHKGELPDYYITPQDAKNNGWNPKFEIFLLCCQKK